ncbi:hypothetical protein O6H91_20G038200 [Diphasiastrum complanatum]|uniref:Uncharacterized protein n=1 Tax=Diphasiastrum complanatum TaxID=34168 RepID=A0ACC2APA3_DIPCM|nr:hypothetical protein O6H91_Y171200 [Diphasiastrum complanatum]KAJ7519434.1 hypothetical protein O6H91_20G038200 [Diphasiastrum complanatum]
MAFLLVTVNTAVTCPSQPTRGTLFGFLSLLEQRFPMLPQSKALWALKNSQNNLRKILVISKGSNLRNISHKSSRMILMQPKSSSVEIRIITFYLSHKLLSTGTQA